MPVLSTPVRHLPLPAAVVGANHPILTVYIPTHLEGQEAIAFVPHHSADSLTLTAAKLVENFPLTVSQLCQALGGGDEGIFIAFERNTVLRLRQEGLWVCDDTGEYHNYPSDAFSDIRRAGQTFRDIAHKIGATPYCDLSLYC